MAEIQHEEGRKEGRKEGRNNIMKNILVVVKETRIEEKKLTNLSFYARFIVLIFFHSYS